MLLAGVALKRKSPVFEKIDSKNGSFSGFARRKVAERAVFNQTPIKIANNTNHTEGSKLSEEQTRYIYETNTFFVENGDSTANVDEIIETENHFSCFDYMPEIAHEPLSEEHIKRFHWILNQHL